MPVTPAPVEAPATPHPTERNHVSDFDDDGPQEGGRKRGGRAMTGRVQHTRNGVLGVIRACPGIGTGSIRELLVLPDYPLPGTPRLSEDGSAEQVTARLRAERLIRGSGAEGWEITRNGVDRLAAAVKNEARPEHQRYLRGAKGSRRLVHEEAA